MPETQVGDSVLIEQLGSTDRSTQRQACDELARRIGQDPKLRDALIVALREGNPRARFASAFVLFGAERPTLRLLPALLDALKITDGDIRWQATHMLSTLGRLHEEVFPVLLHEAQGAQSPLQRRMALYALRELAPERPETALACAAALDDPSVPVRLAALTCFGKLTDSGRPALDRILAIATHDPDPRMQGLATVALPNLTASHPDALPAVEEALRRLARSDHTSVARAATAARMRLDADG